MFPLIQYTSVSAYSTSYPDLDLDLQVCVWRVASAAYHAYQQGVPDLRPHHHRQITPSASASVDASWMSLCRR